ncbi:bifunctional methylenetetrahydrofolate dehydrogenase/methenyltetrahydrofolate cyclohydrolase, partial [Buchnera aphidicola (Hormaphis cornu)]
MNILSSKILNGNQISKKIQLKLTIKIKKYLNLGKRPPGLAVILVGNNPSSKIYVVNKTICCKHVGIFSKCWKFPNTISELKIISLI